MRPCDSVTGTRCTRCTPPSYFSRDQAPSAPLPFTATVASLIAAQAGDGGVQDLGLPAAPFGVTLVHPEQVAGEQRGLLAALARLDLQDDVTPVVRVPRHEQLAAAGPRAPRGARPAARLGGEGGVFPGQLARGLLVRRGLLPLVVGVHDRGQLGVAAAQRARLLLVGVDARVGERVLKLGMLANQVRLAGRTPENPFVLSPWAIIVTRPAVGRLQIEPSERHSSHHRAHGLPT